FATKIDFRYSGIGGHPEDNTTEEFATLFSPMNYSTERYNELKLEIEGLRNLYPQSFYVLCNEFNIISKDVMKKLLSNQIANCPTTL
ncbi:MAG: hypothetical protein UR93_C0032G0006, partial [Berkelbacteria bacterium GW2011_GWA2_35_9]